MRELLQLTGMATNTLVPVPAPLLCVSLILNAATANAPPGLKQTGFVNIDFTIDNLEDMARRHAYYYSGMFNTLSVTRQLTARGRFSNSTSNACSRGKHSALCTG